MSDYYKYPNTPITFQGGPQDFTGTLNLGYYAVETTKRYEYGTRGITWDGKVFKYSRAIAKLAAGYGAFNLSLADVSDLINSVTPAAISAGDRTTTITIAATEGYASDGVVAEDELAGAQIVLGHGSQYTTEQRTVVGNTAGASGGSVIRIWVDYPFALAHDAGVACEIPFNPYRYLGAASEVASVMCVPNVVVAGSGYNFWGQTWGPCWCVPGGGDVTIGDSVNDRTAYFVGDGSVNGGTALTVETGYQPAGFIIDTTEVGTGCMPLVMLQISI
ncbi:MAG: hypothetical protein PHN44_08020 [Candidatus Marinimicrobia bacterium]|nr:hypothetical protein [Candidatus Neomarinimicrobiota bacterium]MDD5541031.1 hypothetical protein [Candidatus Neomarinimicrobiota bacterium]